MCQNLQETVQHNEFQLSLYTPNTIKNVTVKDSKSQDTNKTRSTQGFLQP